MLKLSSAINGIQEKSVMLGMYSGYRFIKSYVCVDFTCGSCKIVFYAYAAKVLLTDQ